MSTKKIPLPKFFFLSCIGVKTVWLFGQDERLHHIVRALMKVLDDHPCQDEPLPRWR